MKKKVAIIGAGISGLSAAAYAAKSGHEVHVFEKNKTAGGRARSFTTENGYSFDMGPSWYWMPDVIEQFFADFGYKVSDFYELIRLDPQFELVLEQYCLTLPDKRADMYALFEQIEPGSSRQLDAFLNAARRKYELSMTDFVQKPCHSWREFLSYSAFKSLFTLNLFCDFRTYVRKYFSHPALITLMEFPVIFLGTSPQKTPAMYSLMNYGGYGMGTHYPMGGFRNLVSAMQQLAEHQGAKFYFGHPIEHIITRNNRVSALRINGKEHFFDAVIASADYHHSETLLAPQVRNYQPSYWNNRTFAPSALVYYLGFNRRIPRLHHHTLFFDRDLDMHVEDIYDHKQWPRNPLFYACCPSKTDPGVAPQGHENIFLLMPLAIGLNDSEAMRESYLTGMLERLEKHTDCYGLADAIDYKRSYCISDFKSDYNAYGGNAYGLANTLSQTAVLKPAIRNRHLANLFYAGQLTVPGPGVPPSLISGKIAVSEVNKLTSKRYENTI